jgi:hypothetical protein
MAKAADDSITSETTYFNEGLMNGKWKGIMSMKPRDLPVFQSPQVVPGQLKKTSKWDLAPEGYDTLAFSNKAEKVLPLFTEGMRQQFFVDIFLCDSITVSWKARPSADWINLSQTGGKLEPEQNKNTQRIWVSIDWENLPRSGNTAGAITFSAAGKEVKISVKAFRPEMPAFSTYRGFAESDGYVSIYAQYYSAKTNKEGAEWILTNGIGHTGNALTAVSTVVPDTSSLAQLSAYVGYEFFSFSTAVPNVTVYTLPTHPLNKKFSMRYGVSIDDGPVRITDFKTVGRSEEWKQNVLRNSATRTIEFPGLKPGRHILKIFVLDPGVVLDRLLISFGQEQKGYSVIPETRKK